VSWGWFIYIEAALSSIGVSSEQLVLNVAEQIRNDVKSTTVLRWPPRVEELEEEEELSPLMLQLLSMLSSQCKSSDASLRCLAFLASSCPSKAWNICSIAYVISSIFLFC